MSYDRHKIENLNHKAMFGIFVGDEVYWNRSYGLDEVSTS